MNFQLRHFLVLLACFAFQLFSFSLFAQMGEGERLTWEEFADEYAAQASEENGETLTQSDLEWLEELALHPLQINRAKREEILSLPFVSEEQADTLLSYIHQKNGIRAWGELMLLRGWDYASRRRLTLFARCDSLPSLSPEQAARKAELQRIAPKLYKGHHELETRLDIPLYKRQGYEISDRPMTTNFYTGNALHHIARYRYNFQREVYYGLTMEKDAGEPVGKVGFYPYDYWSGYFVLRPRGKSWTVALGDYEVKNGWGLLFGHQLFSSREQLTSPLRAAAIKFKPHTGSDEANFFRGAAVSFMLKRLTLALFASYRKLDARLNAAGDTARTWLKTGLHRTLSEISRRRNLGCFTAGADVEFRQHNFGVSLSGYVAHFQYPLCPEWRWYNAYYFRGQTAGGFALNYFFRRGNWTIQGETASDHAMHLATDNRIGYRPSSCLTLNLQVRYFSPRFVSLYGSALQQGSRTANELGCALAVKYLPKREWEISGYADIFRFPKPTYTAVLAGAKGIEVQGQVKWFQSSRTSFFFRYRLKSRQYTLTGYKLLAYRQTHRLRLGYTWSGERFQVTPQLDAAYHSRQSGERSWGFMSSARATWKPSKKFSLRTFAALFFSDDYNSRLYAYEPQLLRSAAFSAFAYHGMRLLLLASYQPAKRITLSLRAGSTHYFNRSEISSGIERIHSPWKNDLSLQCRWVIY